MLKLETFALFYVPGIQTKEGYNGYGRIFHSYHEQNLINHTRTHDQCHSFQKRVKEKFHKSYKKKTVDKKVKEFLFK